MRRDGSGAATARPWTASSRSPRRKAGRSCRTADYTALPCRHGRPRRLCAASWSEFACRAEKRHSFPMAASTASGWRCTAPWSPPRCPDPEGALLAHIRSGPRLPRPCRCSASSTSTPPSPPPWRSMPTALVAYRENPHIDARRLRQSARRNCWPAALRDGELPQHARLQCAGHLGRRPRTGTADRPMRDLEALARRIEARESGDLGRRTSSAATPSRMFRRPVSLFAVAFTGPEAAMLRKPLDRLTQTRHRSYASSASRPNGISMQR
jgi:hypothetical protein